MRGTIIQFTPETHSGLISGHDGTRYNFTRTEWADQNTEPVKGQNVDFEINGDSAKSIIILDDLQVKGDKNKWVAAALAWFFGWIGGHKFYLGQTGWGIAYVLLFWTFIPLLVSIIEFIMLLTVSENKFNQRFNA